MDTARYDIQWLRRVLPSVSARFATGVLFEAAEQRAILDIVYQSAVTYGSPDGCCCSFALKQPFAFKPRGLGG
jgi:hypothetical protein